MKIYLSFIFILLLGKPFAFRKLKGPLHQTYYHSQKEPDYHYVYFLDKNNNNLVLSTGSYLFLYDERTGYAFGCALIDLVSLMEYAELLKGQCKQNSFFQNSHYFFLVKEEPNLDLDYSLIIDGIPKNYSTRLCSPMKGTQHLRKSILECDRWWDPKMLGENRIIKLSKEFKSLSGILIKNEENHVEISRDTSVYDFQLALLRYLSSSNSDDQIDLLNQSHILNVFALIKGDSYKNSIIWGLAEDNVSREKFHWITDIEGDISVLIDQYTLEQ